MKFETWDSKYQVTFARRTNINDFQDILKEYLIEYFALDEENTSFILKPFRMYEIWFRWFQPTRIFCATGRLAECNQLIMFDQSKHLVPINEANVLFKFVICGHDESSCSKNPKKLRKCIKYANLDLRRLSNLRRSFRSSSQISNSQADLISNFLFSKEDLKMLQQSNQEFIDFKP